MPVFECVKVELITKIKALRAGKRQVWPGKGMEQRARDGMEPASVFCALDSGQVKKRAGEMETGMGCEMKLNRASLAVRYNPAYELIKLIKRPVPVRLRTGKREQ